MRYNLSLYARGEGEIDRYIGGGVASGDTSGVAYR